MKNIIISLLAVISVVVIIILLLSKGENEQSTQSNGENHSDNDEQKNEKSNNDKSEQTDDIYATIELEEGASSRLLQPMLLYKIHNDSEEKLVLSFSTSQRYDYRLKNDRAIVIETYSKDKLFMQVTSEIILQPGEQFSESVRLPGLKAGKYTIEIWLTSTGKEDFKKELEFEIAN